MLVGYLPKWLVESPNLSATAKKCANAWLVVTSQYVPELYVGRTCFNADMLLKISQKPVTQNSFIMGNDKCKTKKNRNMNKHKQVQEVKSKTMGSYNTKTLHILQFILSDKTTSSAWVKDNRKDF